MAYSNAGMVFSGRMARAPRCPCTRIFFVPETDIEALALNMTNVQHRKADRLFRHQSYYAKRACPRFVFTRCVYDSPLLGAAPGEEICGGAGFCGAWE